MGGFVTEYLSTMVIFLIVAGMLFLAVRSIRKSGKQGKSCGCSGCSGCAGTPLCDDTQKKH